MQGVKIGVIRATKSSRRSQRSTGVLLGSKNCQTRHPRSGGQLNSSKCYSWVLNLPSSICHRSASILLGSDNCQARHPFTTSMTTRVVSDKVIPLVLEGRVQLLCWSYSDLENNWRGETVVSMMREDTIRTWRNIIRYYPRHHTNFWQWVSHGTDKLINT